MLVNFLFVFSTAYKCIHYTNDLLTKQISLTSTFMASITRQYLISFVFVVMNLFYLVAAMEAHRDPTVLLDIEYQNQLHSNFLVIVSAFYIAFLSIIFLPWLEKVYRYFGYPGTIKQLTVLEIHGKK